MINRNKLPLKYNLGLYEDLPGYPSQSDLEFLLITTLEDRGLMNTSFKPSDIWSGMKSVTGTIDTLTDFLEGICGSDKRFTYFQIRGEKPTAQTYLISSHPWMN